MIMKKRAESRKIKYMIENMSYSVYFIVVLTMQKEGIVLGKKIGEKKELILSHEDTLKILQGLPISDTESLRKRDELVENFQKKCLVKRMGDKIEIEVPDIDIANMIGEKGIEY